MDKRIWPHGSDREKKLEWKKLKEQQMGKNESKILGM